MKDTSVVRLVDVAREAGISPTTAGSVLLGTSKGNVRVSAATSERVRRIAKKMGYYPNTAARQLRSGKSYTIGVLIDSYAPAVTSQKVASIEQSCMQRGYRMIVGQAHNDLKIFKQYINDFLSRGVDGLLCASHDYLEGDYMPKLLQDLPSVLFLGRPGLERPGPYIEVDLADGVAQAVHHLVSRKKDRIGLIQFNPASRSTKQRYEGFVRAFDELGLAVAPECVQTLSADSNHAIAASEIDAVLSEMVTQAQINAVICINDIVAGHVIQSCKRKGWRVPNDIAVIGCDNSDFSSVIDPPLTTIDQNVSEFSERAVDILFSAMSGELDSRAPIEAMVSPRLVVRDSA